MLGLWSGFHQPCFVKYSAGQLSHYFLEVSIDESCSPYFELATKVGQGGRSKPTRRCSAPPSTTPPTGAAAPSATAPSESSPGATPPPPQIRSGLPYLWGGLPAEDTVSDSASPSPTVNESHPPPKPPPLTVQCGLPFLFQTESQAPTPRVDCESYLRGDCRHGVSGKADGGCSKQHRKRCNKFMKWGNRHQNGCSDAECSKVHPLVCDKSLDLKCFDRACPYKLHIFKCKRSDIPPSRVNTGRDRQHHSGGQGQGQGHSSGQGHSGGQGQKGNGRGNFPFHPWEAPVPGHPPQQGHGGGHGVPAPATGSSNQSFQKVTVQPQLEAYMCRIRKDLWQEVGFLRSFLARELQLAQQEGIRPSY